MANMQFPLPEASVMLRFPQRIERHRLQHATLTQKPGSDKHKQWLQ
jgi:hypothetical protein